jgi:redox-sensitive bicupin YhaK (pirin superfamily)
MTTIRRAAERGQFENSWLNANHSFSFGEYYDPDNMGFSNLRVLNDDEIAPNGGFPTHPHDNMEIVTYVLSGQLEHRDSMGNGSVIRPGDVQRMSAGTGIRHSEFNPSSEEPVNLLQIWLRPNRLGVDPEYTQRHFSSEAKRNQLLLIVSPDGRDDSIATWQDSDLYASILAVGEEIDFTPAYDRLLYLHLATGQVTVNGKELDRGDSLVSTESLNITSASEGEFLLFDMPSSTKQ